jgi:hypothetical protein
MAQLWVASSSGSVPGSVDGANQMLEGRVRGREVFEVEVRVEHHPVQVRVVQGVAEVGGDQRGQVLHRVRRRGHRREPGRQAGEALLPQGLPHAVHAAEVGVDGHRRDTCPGHQ